MGYRRRRLRWIWAGAGIVALAAVSFGAYATYQTIKQTEAECAESSRLNAALATPIGDGEPVTVIGDSYSQGVGLSDPRSSWVAQLDGHRVTVIAAANSGYTHGGLCSTPTIPALAKGVSGPVLIQAGINDLYADPADVAEKARALIDALDGPVTLIGPAAAPVVDVAQLARLDDVLASVAKDEGAVYVSTAGWDDLSFGEDGLHLTPEGHEAFGREVAAELGF